MTNFYTDVIKRDRRFGSTEICKDMALLEPEFRAKVEKFTTLATAAGHKVVVLETFRSQARQRQLFAQRKTQLRNVGVHGYGLAIDFALFVNGKYDPNGQDYTCFAPLAKQAGVISGVDWGAPCQHHSFRDSDHLQGVPVFRQNDLFAGKWYPPAGYDPWNDQADHGVK
jgi:hypothetical protein